MHESRQSVLLKGRYEPIERIDPAGEPRVVRAIDHRDGGHVALELGAVGSDDRGDAAGILVGLARHPSLPGVRDAFHECGRWIVVTDWVDGTDLARLLRDNGMPGLPLSSVLAYLAEAADALTFLHAHDIVHGAIEPANLILARGGRVTLVGFGLPPSVGRAGSAGFRAPEREPSRAGDVYALTATAFALLTGAPPGTSQRTASGLDAWLDAALAAGLASDPAQRPAAPGELVESLRTGWAATLPSGVMTFCMTDIEGSTRLWETQPAAMAGALVRHDELIAGVVETHGGRFLKSMGEGDSTTSVFGTAGDAVRAAIEATRAIAREPWPEGAPIRVRVGLHTGEAQRRGGDYFGATLNLGSRVRGEAGGGEILLSSRTAAQVEVDLPEGYAIVDLGPHELRGIGRPEVIKALAGPDLETALAGAECPYRGLLAFEARDRHLFFGREDVVADVVGRIGRGRLLAVVGASGSGKSSLLRAGVLAGVAAGELTVARSARLITPGAEPPLPLEDKADELLVVDQFEELYTQCHDAGRRAAFIDALLSLPGPVVIGVRADFYGEISADAKLAGAVASNQVLLGPMGDEDLRRAIAEPARLAGLRLEPGLVDLVLRDVAGEPGALPLMSHALRETWERRNGRTLTVAAYHESGGVSSAVAQSADAVADGTPVADRPLLRNVFLRLTEIGDDVEDTRRRVRVEELVPQGTSSAIVRMLLERLAEARLVTLDEGTAEVAHEVLIRRWPTLRMWLEEDREGIRLHRRLSDAARLWDRAGREPADLYRGTRLDAAAEWAASEGQRLNDVERDFLDASVADAAAMQRRQAQTNRRLRRALAAGAGLLLVALALLVFALASRQDAVRAQASAQSQALATEAESQITGDPQRALLLARAALAAAATPAADLATSEALDANTARSQFPTFGVQNCASANYLVLVDGGRTAADNTCDGRVLFADLADGRIIRQVRVGPTSTDMILGADGRTLILGTGRDLVGVDVPTGRVRHLFTAPFPIEQVAGPPGRFLAIADTRTVAVVDLRHQRLRVVAHGDPSVNPVNGMMSASARILLIASLGQTAGRGDLLPRLTALDVFSGSRSTVSFAGGGSTAATNFLRVAPDQRTWYVTGALIAARNGNQTATTWAIDARTRRVRWTASGPLGAFASPIQVSPDSRRVAVGYSSGEADVLDAATGRRVVRDSSSSSIAAGDLALPPGDNSLVTASLDGVLRVWSARGSEQLRVQAPADPAVDFAPDGRSLVLVGARGEIVDARTGKVVRTFPGFAASSVFNSCNAACFSASPALGWLTYLDPSSPTPRIRELAGRTGRRVATVTVPTLNAQGVGPDGRIVTAYDTGGQLLARVIEPRTGRTTELPAAPSSDGCTASAPSFTPDSRLMAVGDECLHVAVWDLRTGRLVRTVALQDRSNGSGVRLSPDGRYVLASVQGGAFVRVDLASGQAVEIPGAQAEGKVVGIAPDGRFYAIGRQDGTVDVYDARTLRLVRHHTLINAIQTLAFSPDSSRLAVEDTTNVVHVWDTCAVCENPTALAKLAAQQSVRTLTPAERATFNVG